MNAGRRTSFLRGIEHTPITVQTFTPDILQIDIVECLLSPDFRFPRQIFFSLLVQELGRTLAELRIVRQSIERILPQKIRSHRVFLKTG